jgi:hypothetical protein
MSKVRIPLHANNSIRPCPLAKPEFYPICVEGALYMGLDVGLLVVIKKNVVRMLKMVR